MTDIQEIPLDIAEEVQDIVEDIAETKAEEESEPVVLEEVKPVMKPKAKGRPKGSRNLQPSKPRAATTQNASNGQPPSTGLCPKYCPAGRNPRDQGGNAKAS